MKVGYLLCDCDLQCGRLWCIVVAVSAIFQIGVGYAVMVCTVVRLHLVMITI